VLFVKWNLPLLQSLQDVTGKKVARINIINKDLILRCRTTVRAWRRGDITLKYTPLLA